MNPIASERTSIFEVTPIKATTIKSKFKMHQTMD
jgi:hypothetical protein